MNVPMHDSLMALQWVPFPLLLEQNLEAFLDNS